MDHGAIPNKNTIEILNVRTLKGFFESGHHLLQVKIRTIPKQKKTTQNKILRLGPKYMKINKNKIME